MRVAEWCTCIGGRCGNRLMPRVTSLSASISSLCTSGSTCSNAVLRGCEN